MLVQTRYQCPDTEPYKSVTGAQALGAFEVVVSDDAMLRTLAVVDDPGNLDMVIGADKVEER